MTSREDNAGGGELVILGAGGFGREASLLVEEINCSRREGPGWKLLGFIDEDEDKWGRVLRGYPVLGGLEVLARLPAVVRAIVVVGNPYDKRKLAGLAAARGRRFATLVHPQVELAPDVVLGCGVLVNKGCLFTTSIRVGDHVSINPGCGIGHDAVIGDFTTLMWRVNISGAVTVGEDCLVGTGAVILQEKRIAAGCTVGAGAVVTRDFDESCVLTGVPAVRRFT